MSRPSRFSSEDREGAVHSRPSSRLADFLRLSCQLNVLALREEERIELVRRLAEALSSVRESNAAGGQVGSTLRAYHATGDVLDFVTRGLRL